jgi:hypothetical protein
MNDVQIARIKGQQGAVWLDRSWSMDRLAIAVGEVNRTKVCRLVIHGVRMVAMLSEPTGRMTAPIVWPAYYKTLQTSNVGEMTDISTQSRSRH